MIDQYLATNENSTSVLSKIVKGILYGLWRIAPTLTGKLVLRVFFRPTTLSQRPEEKEKWESGTAFSLRLHERNIQGRYWGDGPGVLFLHGWDGRGSQFYRFIDPVVQAGYRAIAIDGPAHGESDGSYTSYFEFTDVVRALVRGDAGMNVEKVVAHSFGAAAVINALEKDNLNLDVALIAPALRVEEFLHENFQKLGVPFGLFHDILSRFEDRYGYEIHRDNPARLIKTLGCPLMILHDEKDRIVPFAGSAQAADSNSAISLIGTQDLGHTRILFEPETIDAVLSYLFKTESRVSNL